MSAILAADRRSRGGPDLGDPAEVAALRERVAVALIADRTPLTRLLDEADREP